MTRAPTQADMVRPYTLAEVAARAGAPLPDVAAPMNLDAATLRRHYSHGSPIGREIIERIGDE